MAGRPMETYKVKEISKAQIGKVILKECGNEGTVDTEQKANLRRLLQGIIDNFKVWDNVRNNADIQVDDDFGNSIRIVTGEGEYKFVVEKNGKGEIEIIKTKSPGALENMCSVL